MSRTIKLVLNSGLSLFYQIVVVISGFVLPPLIIKYYGSSANGLVASISNFLAFFALTEMGMGAVVRASLYKPLAMNDSVEISKVLLSSRKFFTKIGVFLLLYTIVLIFVFPFISESCFDFVSTAILIAAIAIGSISQYLFGIVYDQLLNASQRAYVSLVISSLVVVLTTIVSVVLIWHNYSLHVVKIATAGIFVFKPLLLQLYVKKIYKIDFSVSYEGEPIKQKWNGLAQHFATYVLKHSDIVVLTFFSNLKIVSIYYVYHLISNGLQSIVSSLSNGFYSLLGDMYAKKEEDLLKRTFSLFEFIIHTSVAIMFSVVFLLILPFVHVYTMEAHDANYIQPLFAYIFLMATMFFCVRTPYYIMVQSAGHFKETQNSAIYEVLINVVVSITLVFNYDLVGVAIGTLLAMIYRTFYLAHYLSKNVLYLPFTNFLKRVIIDVVCVMVCFKIGSIFSLQCNDYFAFFVLGIKIIFFCTLLSLGINIVTCPSDFKALMRYIKCKSL